MKALLRAVHDIAEATPALAGRVHLHPAPEGTAYPYVTVTAIDSLSRKNYGGDWEAAQLQFDVWSRAEGAGEALDLLDTLTTAFDGAVSGQCSFSRGHTIGPLRATGTQENSSAAWRITVTYGAIAP